MRPVGAAAETAVAGSPVGQVVAVVGVGGVEGARSVAAALSCALADPDQPALLIDLDGRPPRPTLVATSAARALEERLAAHRPAARPAARGLVCHLAVAADGEGLDLASAAATVVRGSGLPGAAGFTVVHAPPASLRGLLERRGEIAPQAVLLRADLSADRPLVSLLAQDLRERELGFAVVKRPLGWAASRRAHFGVPVPGALPVRLLRLLGFGEGR